MNCTICGEKMIASLELTGGCSGHYYPDERCYCDSPDVHVEFDCPNQNNPSHRKARKSVRPAGLTDKYSIARWLTENFTVK